MEIETPAQTAEGRRRLRKGVLVLFGLMLVALVAAIIVLWIYEKT
jgi:hypothetical protein